MLRKKKTKNQNLTLPCSFAFPGSIYTSIPSFSPWYTLTGVGRWRSGLWSLCTSFFLFSRLLCSIVDHVHGLQSFRVNPLQHVFLYKLKCRCLLLCSVCTSFRGRWSCILAFLKFDFPEASPSWLRDSAMFCSRSIGAVCLHHGGQLLAPSYMFFMLWINCTKSCCSQYP